MSGSRSGGNAAPPSNVGGQPTNNRGEADRLQPEGDTRPQKGHNPGWRLRHVITVPGEPVPKGRPVFSRSTGTARTPKKTANYEARIKWHTRGPMLEGPVRVDILAVFQRPKRLHRSNDPDGLMFYGGRCDLDNVVKAVWDGLQGAAFKNDRQVKDGAQRIRYTEKTGKPRTEIEVYEWRPRKQPTTNKPTEQDPPNDMAPNTPRPSERRSR